MKSKIRIASLLCALTLIASLMLTPALAASKYTYYNYANTSYSFDVSTGKSNRTLTFKQDKGTIDYTNAASGTSSYNTYGQYLIYITCNGSLYKSLRFDFKQSLSVTLPKNKTYNVSVVPRSPSAVFTTLVDNGKISKWKMFWNEWNFDHKWATAPDWTVTSPVELKNWQTATPAW